MEKMPNHGRINCSKCFSKCTNSAEFDRTQRSEGDWRITMNPLAWGNVAPEVVVLGFSKGPTQAGALATAEHDQIAYKGSRGNVGKILRHVGLLPSISNEDPGQIVTRLIADRGGRFHFGSLIRCTVERQEAAGWKGSGGGMLDKFVATEFGREVSSNCTEMFLKYIPVTTKVIIMFGLGAKQNYVRASFDLYKAARGGNWRWVNEVAYTDGNVTVVHVEHFASQGNLIPRWLGAQDHDRGRFGRMAASAVAEAIA